MRSEEESANGGKGKRTELTKINKKSIKRR